MRFMTPAEVIWDADRHGVTFVVYKDDNPIDCYVTRSAIDDNLGYAVAGTILERARAQFDRIIEQVRFKMSAKAFESDGSILITTGDWKS